MDEGILYERENSKKPRKDMSQEKGSQKEIILSKRYSHEYVCRLPLELEKKVMDAVKEASSSLILSDQERQEAVDNANNSRVCDLTDMIRLVFE